MGERLRVKSLWVKSIWVKSLWVKNLLGKIGVGGMLAFVSPLLRYVCKIHYINLFDTQIIYTHSSIIPPQCHRRLSAGGPHLEQCFAAVRVPKWSVRRGRTEMEI